MDLLWLAVDTGFEEMMKYFEIGFKYIWHDDDMI